MVTIIFNNRTAKNDTVIRCDEYSVDNILDWYEYFYSGDDYTFTRINEDPVVPLVIAGLTGLFIGLLFPFM